MFQSRNSSRTGNSHSHSHTQPHHPAHAPKHDAKHTSHAPKHPHSAPHAIHDAPSHGAHKTHAPAHHAAPAHKNPMITRGGPDDSKPTTHASHGSHGSHAPHTSHAKEPAVKLFSELALSAPVLKALVEEGYTVPTPIQAQAIPQLMAGKDMFGCAQTGTGKTAAFALPILHLLTTEKRDTAHRGAHVPRALILSPTRELATQIGDSFAAYGRHTGLRGTCIFGGVSQGRQVRALRDGIDILVATPGRLIDLVEQRLVDLSQIKIFVLDEADRMLDMGFIAPIRRIASLLKADRQTMMFSATMPKEIMRLAESLLKNPVKVAVTPVASAAPLIEQSLYMVQKRMKPALLEHILQEAKVSRGLVFTKTKHGADKLTKILNRASITATAIHGNKAQNQRERALDGFRSGRCRILVATDVAARGLDVDGITHVFNFDLPMEPEGYVHRIGRTGRAGATGIAISFCDGEERGLMRDIERITGKRFNPITKLPALPEPAAPTHADDDRDERRHYGGGNSRGHSGRPGWSKPATGQGHAPSHASSHPARPSHAPHTGRPRTEGTGHTPRAHADGQGMDKQGFQGKRGSYNTSRRPTRPHGHR